MSHPWNTWHHPNHAAPCQSQLLALCPGLQASFLPLLPSQFQNHLLSQLSPSCKEGGGGRQTPSCSGKGHQLWGSHLPSSGAKKQKL